MSDSSRLGCRLSGSTRIVTSRPMAGSADFRWRAEAPASPSGACQVARQAGRRRAWSRSGHGRGSRPGAAGRSAPSRPHRPRRARRVGPTRRSPGPRPGRSGCPPGDEKEQRGKPGAPAGQAEEQAEERFRSVHCGLVRHRDDRRGIGVPPERHRFCCNAAKSDLPFVSDPCFQAQECCAEVSRGASLSVCPIHPCVP